MSRIAPGQLRFFRSAIGSTAFVLILAQEDSAWWRCAEWNAWSPADAMPTIRKDDWLYATTLVSEPGETGVAVVP